MAIRTASASDVKKIISITEQNKWNARSGFGLADYSTGSERDYLLRIERNPFFYVTEFDGDIVGFLAAYDHDAIFRLVFDDLANYVAQKSAPYVYIDVVAVETEHRRQGIASGMLTQLFADAKRTGHGTIWSAAVQLKEKTAGTTFLEKAWLKRIEERRFYGHKFGIYRKFL